MDINPEDVLMWDIEKLWNTLKATTEKTEYQKEKHKIKYGINMEFPIHNIIYEWYQIYPVSKRVTIKGHGKWKLQDFMNEIEDREELLRKIIIKSLHKEEIATPRT